jgi:hypothetical protein
MTTPPLKVLLADGCQVMSIHMCDIIINGLPFVLIGLIIPGLSVASLFGIRVLMEAGCKVTFVKHRCVVRYNGKIISSGGKDLATNLWTLPFGSASMTSQHVTDVLPSVAPVVANAHAHHRMQIAFFMHTIHTKAISFCLPISCCAAYEFPLYSKQYTAATSKCALT